MTSYLLLDYHNKKLQRKTLLLRNPTLLPQCSLAICFQDFPKKDPKAFYASHFKFSQKKKKQSDKNVYSMDYENVFAILFDEICQT